jgi:hypothetical protein
MMPVVLGLLALQMAGCPGDCGSSKSGPSSDVGQRSPVERAAREFLKAVQYRDVEGAWRLHAASTHRGSYCRSEAFAKVLSRTRNQKTETDCRDARNLTERQRDDMAEDAALLVQILRFACEHPDGDCLDYQKEVFFSQFPETSFWLTLDGFEIGEVRTTGETAKIYVDYWSDDRSEGTTEHRMLEMRRIDGTWVITTIFGADDSQLLNE